MAKRSRPKRHIFEILFGETTGEILKIFIGITLAFAFMIFIIYFVAKYIPSKLGVEIQEDALSQENLDLTLLEPMPVETQKVVNEITGVSATTQKLLKKLEEDIKQHEKILEEKKSALVELEKEIGLLELTPEQLEMIKKYKISTRESISFGRWILRREIWYGFIGTFLISFFFYWLGGHKVRKRFKIKKNEKS